MESISYNDIENCASIIDIQQALGALYTSRGLDIPPIIVVMKEHIAFTSSIISILNEVSDVEVIKNSPPSPRIPSCEQIRLSDIIFHHYLCINIGFTGALISTLREQSMFMKLILLNYVCYEFFTNSELYENHKFPEDCGLEEDLIVSISHIETGVMKEVRMSGYEYFLSESVCIITPIFNVYQAN